jgi:hypothetical protein
MSAHATGAKNDFVYRLIFWFISSFFLSALSSIVFAGSDYLDSPLNASLNCAYEGQDLIMPLRDDKGSFEVGIGILPLSVSSFDAEESSATIDFYFTVEYLVDANLPDTKCLGNLAGDVWKLFYNPDLEFMNIPDPQEVQGSSWLIEDGRFAYLTRVMGTVNVDSGLARFPFDQALIRVIVAGEDAAHITRLLPSVWYHEDLSQLATSLDRVRVRGWRIRDANFDLEVVDGWDELTLTVEFERISLPLVVRLGLPMIILWLIVIVSTTSSRLSVSDKLSVQASVLISFFALNIFLVEAFPQADYLTFADLSWGVYLVSTFLILCRECIDIKTEGAARGRFFRTPLLSTSILLIVMYCLFGIGLALRIF